MSKSQDTIRMTNAVKQFVYDHTNQVLLQEEYVIPHTLKRADLGADVCYKGEKGMLIIEIKNSKADMHSGYGMNFIGMINYIAVPPELVGSAIRYLIEKDISRTGVLEVTYNNVCEILPYSWMDEED